MSAPEPIARYETRRASTFPPTAVQRLLKAFTYRDFRILWFGSFTSSIGTWVQSVAENWLVFSLTGSAFFLGLDAFLQQIPILLFSLLGGVVADRMDRRKLLLLSQYVQMGCALTLASLVYFERIHLWHILTLSFVAGTAQAFGGPASQALMPALVDKQDLPNAVALNSIQFNLARVVGPLFAGATLATLGMALCFALNGTSFLVVIAALFALRIPFERAARRRRIVDELVEGVRFVRRNLAILQLTVLAAATTFLAFAVLTLLPVIARNLFHEGVGLYSRLLAFSGVGSVVGALIVAWLGNHKKMGAVALGVQALCGALLVGFALSRNLRTSEVLLFLIGGCLVISLATISSLVQLLVPNELRGRVMSIYMVAFRGGMPLGSLLAGWMANRNGIATVLSINGGALLLVAAVFSLCTPLLRNLQTAPRPELH